MIYRYKKDEVSPSYVMGGSEKIPIIQMMKIIKEDIERISDCKYDLEDIDYLLRAKYKTPMEQRNYIYALEEDMTNYITQKYRYNKVHNSIFRDIKNSLQYDMSHIYPLICGQKFIVKTPDHFSKQDYTDYILEEIFDISCAIICFEGKSMYTNLIAMFQKSENIISFSYDNEEYKGNAYRLSLASVQNRDEQYIIPIAEYILEKECFLKNGVLFSESGTSFCQGKCNIASHVKVVINDKYERNYCLNKSNDNKLLCTCRSLNPANIIGGIGYALYHLHNREDISKVEHIRNAEEKHGTVSLCDSDIVSEDFPSYHVIRVSPNYSYSNDDAEDIVDEFHAHKSPIEHYRKGTPVIINKNGTVYSRKATIVNKGNTDNQTVYKV